MWLWRAELAVWNLEGGRFQLQEVGAFAGCIDCPFTAAPDLAAVLRLVCILMG